MAALFQQMELFCMSPKFNLMHLVSLETLESPLEFNKKLWNTQTITEMIYNRHLQSKSTKVQSICLQKSLSVEDKWYPVTVSWWQIREMSSGTVSVGKVVCCCLCMLCWSATEGNLSDCFAVCENSGGRLYLLWVIAFPDWCALFNGLLQHVCACVCVCVHIYIYIYIYIYAFVCLLFCVFMHT